MAPVITALNLQKSLKKTPPRVFEKIQQERKKMGDARKKIDIIKVLKSA